MTQTERFEQEVTINLEPDAASTNAPQDDKPNRSLLQLDELIRTTIDLEVTSFYIDYGGHVSQQLVALLCLLAVHKLPVRDRFVYPGTAYFLAKALHICFWIRKMKSRNLLRVIYLVELLAALTIVSGLQLFESKLFIIPLLLFVLLFISQIILYCLNFADSIDQTFLFKLVRASHQFTNLPKILAKLQVFLIFIKLSSAMTTVWMTVLTPTWLVGSAFLGGSLYCSFICLVKLAVYVFKRKNKRESTMT